MQETIIATIPQGDANSMLEVAYVHDAAGHSRVELRCLTWGAGVGWYRQHTLKLDRTAAHTLSRRLASGHPHSKPAPAGPETGKVIPFPRPALAQPEAQQRAAQG